MHLSADIKDSQKQLTLRMRARCAIMPGLCSVGWRLVSIKSPSFKVRYTILPLPLPLRPPAVLLAVARASSCLAMASRFCRGLW